MIPVFGELHFSRVPRSDWDARLRLMRAGGATAVSTYVIWIHHEAERGEVSFDGGLDVGAFIDTAEAAGLDVVLRIGPWAHGEVRNGGLPDWVQRLDVRHRTDDPGYLEVVRSRAPTPSSTWSGRATWRCPRSRSPSASPGRPHATSA